MKETVLQCSQLYFHRVIKSAPRCSGIVGAVMKEARSQSSQLYFAHAIKLLLSCSGVAEDGQARDEGGPGRATAAEVRPVGRAHRNCGAEEAVSSLGALESTPHQICFR